MSERGFPERNFDLVPLRRLSARLVPHDWVWARENAAAIARNWRRRRVAQPALFDGPVFLAKDVAIRDGVGTVTFFETRYSHFIAFRDEGGPDPSVANAFAAIVPHTADGAVLLGEMGPHTANAGQLYFPCGTPDRDDLRPDGSVDLEASAAREFLEETGLPSPGEGAPSWVLVRGPGQLAFLRPVAFADAADALVARSDAYRQGDSEPELSRIVVARSRADIDPERMPGFVRTYLGSVFAA